jgi:hypothetical protein
MEFFVKRVEGLLADPNEFIRRGVIYQMFWEVLVDRLPTIFGKEGDGGLADCLEGKSDEYKAGFAYAAKRLLEFMNEDRDECEKYLNGPWDDEMIRHIQELMDRAY